MVKGNSMKTITAYKNEIKGAKKSIKEYEEKIKELEKNISELQEKMEKELQYVSTIFPGRRF